MVINSRLEVRIELIHLGSEGIWSIFDMIVGFVFEKDNYLNKVITTQNTFDLVVHDIGQHDIATLEIHLMQYGKVRNKQVKDE